MGKHFEAKTKRKQEEARKRLVHFHRAEVKRCTCADDIPPVSDVLKAYTPTGCIAGDCNPPEIEPNVSTGGNSVKYSSDVVTQVHKDSGNLHGTTNGHHSSAFSLLDRLTAMANTPEADAEAEKFKKCIKEIARGYLGQHVQNCNAAIALSGRTSNGSSIVKSTLEQNEQIHQQIVAPATAAAKQHLANLLNMALAAGANCSAAVTLANNINSLGEDSAASGTLLKNHMKNYMQFRCQ